MNATSTEFLQEPFVYIFYQKYAAQQLKIIASTLFDARGSYCA